MAIIHVLGGWLFSMRVGTGNSSPVWSGLKGHMRLYIPASVNFTIERGSFSYSASNCHIVQVKCTRAS